MQSKKRVLDALNHHQPDKTPVDFGATVVSCMHVSCVAALREYYGLEKKPVQVIDPFQMIGQIDEDLKQVIGVDVEGVRSRENIFGLANENWKEWRMDDGLTVLVPGQFFTREDGAGSHYVFPRGDLTAPPSGRMTKGGYYFDAIVRQEEIDEDNLNPEDNLEEYQPISDADLQYFTDSVKAAAKTGRGVIANFGGSALGDIAAVPATFLTHPKGIRDVAEWYISTVARRDYVHEVFDRQTKTAIENLEKLNRAVGDMVDVVYLCGTDFGTQTSTFCSPKAFEELYFPYYKRMNDWIRKNTAWKSFKHSCGAISTLLDLFIDAGFDIVNPVQCSAAGMEAKGLKDKYGDRLTFWGGGVDTQRVLPFGTPEEVRAQVLERCEIFSKNGGFIFGAIHNIQAKTPVKNIVAMIDAVKEFNK